MSKELENFERVDREIDRMAAEENLPGLAVVLTGRERTLHAATYGYANQEAKLPATARTIFEIGSIGKTFTAILLLQQAEQSKLDLRQPVSTYLPWFSVQSDYPPVTVHDLLCHAGGIPAGTDLAPHGYFEVYALREQRAGTPPGTAFHYSNVGYKTLGYLLEAITGMSYGEILKTRILDPLGMLETHALITLETRRQMAAGYRPLYDDRPVYPGCPLTPAEWHEYAGADGSVAAAPEDLAAFLRMLLNHGQAPSCRILTEESWQLMTRGYVDISETGGVGFAGGRYGYGLMIREIDGHLYAGHLGSTPGYRAAMIGDLDDGIGVTLQANGWGDLHAIALRVLELLRDIALSQGPSEGSRAAVPVQGIRVDDYVGKYRCGDKGFVVEANGNQANLVTAAGAPAALEPRGKDLFFIHHPDFSLFLLCFIRDERQQVTEAYYGPDWYTNSRYQGPREYPYPVEWDRFSGHYRSHNPWMSNFRIFIRKGSLWLGFPTGNEEMLVPLESDIFRVGQDERSPERIRFDSFVNAQALRANFSGSDYYRTFTP